jgi:transcriptional regulator with XRE-family HTH domain
MGMNQLKFFRMSKGLSQLALALRLGVSEKTISCWETKRTEPRDDAAIDIARVLEVLPEEIWPERFGSHKSKNG